MYCHILRVCAIPTLESTDSDILQLSNYLTAELSKYKLCETETHDHKALCQKKLLGPLCGGFWKAMAVGKDRIDGPF